MATVIERAKELLTKPIEELGYEVVEITYGKNYGQNDLTVFIYKKGGVGLDDCERVNNALDSLLDENDISDGVCYNLNISSPGLDRPILSGDDYRRNEGEEIEIIFNQPLGKKKKAVGILKSYDDNTVTLTAKDKDTVYDKANIAIARPYINFK